MKISIACDDGKYFSEIKAAGFDGVDLSFADHLRRDEVLTDAYTCEIEDIKLLASRADLSVCQTHLTYYPGHIPPVGDGSYEAFEDFILPLLEKEIELTAMLGCSVAAMHLYFEADREKSRAGNMKLIEKLLPSLERCGVVLAIENIYGPDYSDAHLSTAEDLLYYVNELGSPYIGVCLDTGHAVIRGQDPVEMLARAQESLCGLHLHSTVPNIDLHSIPYCISYGETVDWKKFSRVLKDSSYSGSFNLEVRPPVEFGSAARSAYYKLAYEAARNIID
ncbi:MAG: sugar phosphate isomerase/epimerase [Ruminococcaceae bacterium]|nr:sugar phosphate isomerase/epimerase [Oscillospiraceae bacterium]